MNLAEFIDQHALERPDHPAIEDGGLIVSYSELRERVATAAANLHLAGIRPGDVVAVMLPDSVNHIAVLYALARLGAINFALDPTLPKLERERSAQGLALKAMVSYPGAILPDGVNYLNVLEMCGRSAANAPLEAPPRAEFDENWIAMIVTSTGTTGSQKRIPLRYSQILYWNSLYIKYTGLTVSDRYLSVVHLAFVAGIWRCIKMLHLGATVVINHASTIDTLFDYAAKNRINCTFLTPSHLRYLLEFTTGDKPMMPALKLLVATSRLSPAERRLVRRRLTPNLIETYGINEAGLVAVATPEDQDAHPESVGRLIEEVEAEVVDD